MIDGHVSRGRTESLGVRGCLNIRGARLPEPLVWRWRRSRPAMMVSLNIDHTTIARRRLCREHDVAGNAQPVQFCSLEHREAFGLATNARQHADSVRLVGHGLVS